MAIEIVKEREAHSSEDYFLDFCNKDFCLRFPCDKEGNVDTSSFSPKLLENWLRCQNPNWVKSIRREVCSWTEHAVGRCHCGREVELFDNTNTCECGSEYNMSGQQLAPREQWGEETGEHWSECY